MLTVLLPALECIVNRALASDANALEKLSSINNQVIKIHCTDWNFSFFIVVGLHGLAFHTRYFSQENTLLESTGNHFLHIFMKGADTKTLFEHPLTISGNTHNLEVLRDSFNNLDLDLEEKLSKIIGDVAAYRLFSTAKQGKNTLKTTTAKLSDQLKEYLYFEAKHFPTRKQVEKFYQDSARLRDDVARTEARLTFLANKHL